MKRKLIARQRMISAPVRRSPALHLEDNPQHPLLPAAPKLTRWGLPSSFPGRIRSSAHRIWRLREDSSERRRPREGCHLHLPHPSQTQTEGGAEGEVAESLSQSPRRTRARRGSELRASPTAVFPRIREPQAPQANLGRRLRTSGAWQNPLRHLRLFSLNPPSLPSQPLPKLRHQELIS